MFLRKRKPVQTDDDKGIRTPATTPSPAVASDSSSSEEETTQLLPEDILSDAAHLFYHQMERQRPFYRKKRFNFMVGIGIGLLAMWAASTTPAAQTTLNDLQDFLLLQLADIDLQSILPQHDMVDEFLGNFTSFIKPTPATEISFMPAAEYKDQLGLKPHFPVVMIPGIVSSGLESWSTEERARKYFRKRMWGSMSMIRSVLLNKEDWIQNIMLDPVTGLDPPCCKVRAVQGVEAADYFITGYWVWAKIIENLATIGYDTNTMYFASYDWRLSFHNLEVRDHYFSMLKSKIEFFKMATGGLKSVVVTHSMGSCVFPYFLKWVEHESGGKGGPTWVDDHIESFVNIGGPIMGVPKAVTSLLSGETRDTMALGSFGAYVLEKFFSRRERVRIMRSWFGGSSMIPKGGEAVWGQPDSAPDDEEDEKYESFGNMVSFVPHPAGINENSTDIPSSAKDPLLKNYTVNGAIELLLKNADANFEEQLAKNYSFGVTTDKQQLLKNEDDHTKWSNPLESRLPVAPNMKIYCMYGTGVPTERSYYYAAADEAAEETCDVDETIETACVDGDEERTSNNGSSYVADSNEVMVDVDDDKNSSSGSNNKTVKKRRHHHLRDLMKEQVPSTRLYIDASINNPVRRIETGIRFSDGDGTVPLVSLGYMCAPSGGWRKHADLYNPGHSEVVLREYKHEQSPSKLDVRGGYKAADHIDILGNWEMTLDLLLLVSGKGDNVTERIYSPIEEYAKKVHLPGSNP